MKKLFAALLFAGLSLTAMAQSRMTEEQKQEARARYEAYKQKLNLSPEQSQKVESINNAFFEDLARLKAEGGSKLSRLRKMKELSNKRDGQMKQVLDDRQYKLYKEQQKEMREQFKNNRGR